MSDPAALLDAALELTDYQRATLALRLIESIDGPPDEGVEEAWADEVGRRVQSLRDGTAKTVQAADVRARVRSRLTKLHG
jgi:putative addiction module component (TIGR02574 family)